MLDTLRAFTIGQKYQTVLGVVWAELGSFLGAFTVGVGNLFSDFYQVT